METAGDTKRPPAEQSVFLGPSSPFPTISQLTGFQFYVCNEVKFDSQSKIFCFF